MAVGGTGGAFCAAGCRCPVCGADGGWPGWFPGGDRFCGRVATALVSGGWCAWFGGSGLLVAGLSVVGLWGSRSRGTWMSLHPGCFGVRLVGVR